MTNKTEVADCEIGGVIQGVNHITSERVIYIFVKTNKDSEFVKTISEPEADLTIRYSARIFHEVEAIRNLHIKNLIAINSKAKNPLPINLINAEDLLGCDIAGAWVGTKNLNVTLNGYEYEDQLGNPQEAFYCAKFS